MSDEVSGEIPADESVVDETSPEVDPIDEALAATEKESAPKTYRVKVNGQELDVDEDELLKGYQMASAAQQKFREAADYRTQVEDALAAAKQDPSVLFQMLGLDPRQYAEGLLARQLEEELLTPEEKAQREKEARLAEYERREREAEAARRQSEQEALFNQAADAIDREIADVLVSSNIQPSPRVIARMAEVMIASLDGSGNRVSAKQALSHVQTDIQADLLDYAKSLPAEELVKVLPGDVVKALRQHFVNEVKARVPSKPSRTQSTKQRTEPKRGLTADEMWK